MMKATAGYAALRGVDLEVHRGELVMLMGPSGSGKTTLLSIMGCILTSTSGSVRVAGKEVTALKPKQMPSIRLDHIGFVFQGFNLFPTFTAGENVELMLDLKRVETAAVRSGRGATAGAGRIGGKVQELPRRSERRAETAGGDCAGIGRRPADCAGRRAHAALDSHTGRNVMEMMRGLAHERGRAVVIVTHDSRVMEFADRSIRIEDGMIAINLREEIGESPPGAERLFLT